MRDYPRKAGARFALVAFAIALGVTACDRDPEPEAVAVPGVDMDNRILYVGALNDQSGPAAELGRPFSLGLGTLIHRMNRGDTDLLPEGWRVRLVEHDHAYDPERVEAGFEDTHDEVLFYVSVFGSSPVMQLQPKLREHGIVAFPTSAFSGAAEHPYTPTVGTSYEMEGMRAMDWAVDHRGADALRAGVIYRDDEYGRDAYRGWLKGATHYGIEVLAEHAISPADDDADMADAIASLAEQDVDVVFLATLPPETVTVVTIADSMDYRPGMWIGSAPFMTERFFDHRMIDPALFENTYLVTGFPVWGDQTPVVRQFRESLETYTEGRIRPNTYILASYVWAQPAFEAFRRALASGDVSREGYLKALQSIDDLDLNGAFPDPLDFTTMPYRTATRMRVLYMDMDAGALVTVDDYAAPRSLEPVAAR